MKKIALAIAILSAATLLSSMPVLAEEGTSGVQKDECLLMSQNCRGDVDTIMHRIDRLNIEINKGSSVYTQDELQQLKSRLNEENELLKSVMEGGA